MEIKEIIFSILGIVELVTIFVGIAALCVGAYQLIKKALKNL